jgi:hypothetical protein|tara:strand:- start:973 stop:1131 length:159 start_codon:yes stop_codon:yes gene_type:complete
MLTEAMLQAGLGVLEDVDYDLKGIPYEDFLGEIYEAMRAAEETPLDEDPLWP